MAMFSGYWHTCCITTSVSGRQRCMCLSEFDLYLLGLAPTSKTGRVPPWQLRTNQGSLKVPTSQPPMRFHKGNSDYSLTERHKKQIP